MPVQLKVLIGSIKVKIWFEDVQAKLRCCRS